MILLPLVLFAALAGETALPSAEEVQAWLTYYYLRPRPELVLPSLAVMDRELQKAKGRSLAGEVDRGGMRTFYAQVFAHNDTLVEEVGRRLHSLPTDQQTFVMEALRRCATPACANIINVEPGGLDATPPTSPGALDDAWAAFFATGDAKYVRQVIEVLPWSEVQGDTNRLLTGGAARWSLASNAYQHSRVLSILEESAVTATGTTKRMLDDLIAQAKKARAEKPPSEPTRGSPSNNAVKLSAAASAVA